MRKCNLLIVSGIQLCIAVNSYAVDPQQSFERQRRVPPVPPAVQAPAQQQVVQINQSPVSRQQDRNRQDRSQYQNSSRNGVLNGGASPSIQVVPIDRLRVEPEAVAEYQPEPIQVVTVVMENTGQSGEEVNAEQSSDAAVEEAQQEPVEGVAEEPVPAESETGAVEEPDGATQGAEQSALQIIEEHGQFVVVQVESVL